MGLSRRLPRSTEPTSQEALDRMMEDLAREPVERRPEQERDLPVPDTDGNPVSQRSSTPPGAAFARMEREPFDMSQVAAVWAARADRLRAPHRPRAGLLCLSVCRIGGQLEAPGA